MNEEVYCMGCGVPIQTKNKSELGYAPSSALNREHIICQRCFRLKHYNEIQDVSMTDDDYLKILANIGEQKALVVKIVDIFDFTGSWLPGIHRFVGNNEIILVGNKVDLLPKSVKHNRLIQWMKMSAKTLGLKPLDVHLISAEKGTGMKHLAAEIDNKRAGKDVYVIGCTNVGKSTFINQLIKMFGESDEQLLTTSRFPGTTLNLIEIPLGDAKSIYDTPGIINHHQMAHFVNKAELKIISPKKEIKPKVYQLNEKQTLFFGGLARFDFVRGVRRPFICYFANELYIHRTKLEQATELYEKQKGKLLVPPHSENRHNYPAFKKHMFTIKNEKTDVVFSGLGWVTVDGSSAEVIAYAPEGVGVSIRQSLI